MRKSLLLTSAALIAMGIGLSSCDFLGNKNEEVEYIPVQQSEGGAWIFVNDKGEVIGKQTWEFEPSMTKGGIFVTRNDSSLAVYAWDKDEAKPIDSLQNLVSVGVLNDGLIPVTPHMKRIRIVDKKGNLKFELEPIGGKEISSCSTQFSEGLLVVNTIDDKAGVIDKEGKVVVEPRFSEISDFSGGYALGVDYDYDNYENGPKYYIIDKEGNITKVSGKFGYEEGEGYTTPSFVDGVAQVVGQMDSTNYTYKYCYIHTDGKVVEKDNFTYTIMLPNGDKIIREYSEDGSKEIWVSAEGKIIKKAPEKATFMNYGNYVTEQEEKTVVIYNLEGTKINTLTGDMNPYWSEGKFGLVMTEYDPEYKNPSTYFMLDAEGKPIPNAKYFGVGTRPTIDLSSYEGEYDGEYDYYPTRVTSAYVDVTAAATKIVEMVNNGVTGKENYWLGESVATIYAGESAKYYTYMGRKFSIPTDSTYYLATGAGFRITGMGEASQDIVEPTYQQYFEVDHYDAWGRAWGWNRTRQTGVHFNKDAKVICFDLSLRTNHPSGSILRDAIARRLKKNGFTETSNNENYGEFTNGYKNVIVYGNKNTDGIGVLIYDNDSYYYISDSDKAALAAKI